MFGAKVLNEKFSLKFQLFRFKMEDRITMSNHISNLSSLLRKLAEVKALIDDDASRAILSNSFPSKYNNVIFTLSQITSQNLEDMILSLLAEEKRTNVEDSEDVSQLEKVLYSQRNNKSSGARENVCFYCKKKGHTIRFCKIWASDLLKGKLKDESDIWKFSCIQDEDSSDDKVIFNNFSCIKYEDSSDDEAIINDSFGVGGVNHALVL